MIPGMGRSPAEGKGYPLQYSGLENSMDCIVWGCKELDMIERLSLSLSGLRREMSETVFVNFLWLEKIDCIWETRSFMIGSVQFSRSVMSDSFQPYKLYSPWNSPGQNTGVGSLSLLQGIFPSQGSNPGILYCRRILYQLSHKGSPRILDWVVYPFSSGYS